MIKMLIKIIDSKDISKNLLLIESLSKKLLIESI